MGENLLKPCGKCDGEGGRYEDEDGRRFFHPCHECHGARVVLNVEDVIKMVKEEIHRRPLVRGYW